MAGALVRMESVEKTTSAEVAFAIAAISVGLPHAPSTAFARLAVITACCEANDWSMASRVALARQATDWLALAHHLRLPITALQEYEQSALLKLLAGRLANLETRRTH
ncbi:MAG: hypothetical protein K8U57_06735 [Planctomycetes bacterium]|nr:hypothetical protein [Planctomycetota bacterium]